MKVRGNRSSSWCFYDRWEAFWAFCVPHQPRPNALLKPEQVQAIESAFARRPASITQVKREELKKGRRVS